MGRKGMKELWSHLYQKLVEDIQTHPIRTPGRLEADRNLVKAVEKELARLIPIWQARGGVTAMSVCFNLPIDTQERNGDEYGDLVFNAAKGILARHHFKYEDNYFKYRHPKPLSNP